jgi:hypothetical protein
MKNRIALMFGACMLAVCAASIADAGIFSRRGGGCSSCANGGGCASCANGHCDRPAATSSSNNSYGGSTPRRAHTLLCHRSSNTGGCAGDTRSGSSSGGFGGHSGWTEAADGACECTCPNCGTKFSCRCSRPAQSVASSLCNCCDKCTGKAGCSCGCANCKCNDQRSAKSSRGGGELDPTRPPGMKSRPAVKPEPPAEK